MSPIAPLSLVRPKRAVTVVLERKSRRRQDVRVSRVWTEIDRDAHGARNNASTSGGDGGRLLDVIYRYNERI